MSNFDDELQGRLEQIQSRGLRRELRRIDSPQGTAVRFGGAELVNFSSNDYLGLANHPVLKEAAIKAVEAYGAGAGASRLICGSLAPHHELEEALAAFKGSAAALSFSSGYATALGTICALLGKEDCIILDKLVHACIVDAARLCGARLRVFGHNDLTDLEDLLRWADTRSSGQEAKSRRPRTLVVTESVFSMDGDPAPLRQIVELKEKYGAWLMVDEAHATGLYGARRRGLAEESGVEERIEVQMGTLGKALGASGGYICGSRTLVDYLVNRARSFIFSTAPVPAAAAAARAAVGLLQTASGEQLQCFLWQRVDELQTRLVNKPGAARSAILPLIVGDETAAVELSSSLRQEGFFVPAIRYPTVARGSARLRITLTAAHSRGQIQALADALRKLHPGTSVPHATPSMHAPPR